MRKGLLISLALVLAAILPCSASAGIITFDPFPSIPAGVTVQYFTPGLTGPLAALPVPNAVALRSTPSAIPGGGNALLSWDDPAFGPFGVLLTFNTPLLSITAVGNDFGGDPVRDNEIVHLTAFNSLGTLIGSSTFSSPFADPNLKPVSFAGSDIKYVALTWQVDLGYYAWDNIEYTPVPEPGTLLLLGGGLAGVALRRRRNG